MLITSQEVYMKTKYELINFRLSEKEIIEKHFNEMSINGWNVKWLSNYIVAYEKNDKTKHYHLDYNIYPFSNSLFDFKEPVEIQNQLYDDLGFEYECASNYVTLYSSSNISNVLYTDDESKLKTLKNVNKKHLFDYLIWNLVHIFLMFMSIKIDPIDFIFTNVYNYLFLYITSLIILLVANLSLKQRKLSTIKIQTLINLVLLITILVCPYIIYFKIMTTFNTFVISALLLAKTNTIYLQDLFLHKDINKYHNHNIIHLISWLLAIVLVSGFIRPTINNAQNIDKKPFSHTIITNSITENYKVTQSTENENNLLVQIECVSEDLNDGSKIFNYFYYYDKKEILKPLIWNNYTSVNDYYYIKSINNIELYSDNPYFLNYNDAVSRFILKKENEYIQLIISGKLNENEIIDLTNSINWQK